tara:strand:+ start:140 stop:355 length:216 start_codon:yes stop_codon:yes gene_type:complete
MRRLGNTHRYWLNEVAKKTEGLLAGDYSGTSHEFAIEGLINMGLIEIKEQLTEEISLVVITSRGTEALKGK